LSPALSARRRERGEGRKGILRGEGGVRTLNTEMKDGAAMVMAGDDGADDDNVDVVLADAGVEPCTPLPVGDERGVMAERSMRGGDAGGDEEDVAGSASSAREWPDD
jgi:hypothetical protein